MVVLSWNYFSCVLDVAFRQRDAKVWIACKPDVVRAATVGGRERLGQVSPRNSKFAMGCLGQGGHSYQKSMWMLTAACALATLNDAATVATRHGTRQPLTRAFASPSRIVVAYVSGKDAVSRRRFVAVRQLWASMQTEYSRWSLRCLLAVGGYEHAPFKYDPDPICPT
eukprot:167480-Prymnesium_polylepis.1